MTPAETAALLRQLNEWRRGADIDPPGPLAVGNAIDAAIEMVERLEAAEKSDAESLAMYRKARDERDALRAALRHEADCVESAKAEIDALRAKIETAENDAAHQKALAESALRVAEGWERKCGELRAALRHEADCVEAAKAEIDALSGAQNVPKAVAYLDLGTGGYMDIGTDLTDEALSALPKGRHMLGIVGTYGVDGYAPAQPAPSDEYVGWYCAHCQRGVDASEVTYHEQHQVCGRVITEDKPPKPAPSVPEGWLRAIDEALVVAHVGVANAGDTYEQAKAKLESLIGFHVDVATDPAVNGGWQLVPVNPTEAFYQCFSAYDGTSYSNPFDRDEFVKDWREALAKAMEAKP